MADIKTLVEVAILENKVAVFSKSYCPYCRKAKALLDEYVDVKPIVYELDERDDGAAIQDYLEERTGQRTVPNIFINQSHIGGSSDLQALKTAGKLDALLA